MSISYVIEHTQCPECAKLGKDNKRDNRAMYSDGHSYCYSCGATVFPNSVTKFKNMQTEMTNLPEPYYLPVDCDIIYPQKALDWIEQYELTKTDLLNNNVLWSESMKRLIFPIYGNGNLLAWQGRYFGEEPNRPKWFGKGNLKDTFNILGKGDILVLTEDIISAIKVSKCGCMSMPLYGCVVGKERFKRLFQIYKNRIKIHVWLDPDKRIESIKESTLGRLYGTISSAIFSEKDPKEMTYTEIKELLLLEGHA